MTFKLLYQLNKLLTEAARSKKLMEDMNEQSIPPNIRQQRDP